MGTAFPSTSPKWVLILRLMQGSLQGKSTSAASRDCHWSWGQWKGCRVPEPLVDALKGFSVQLRWGFRGASTDLATFFLLIAIECLIE